MCRRLAISGGRQNGALFVIVGYASVLWRLSSVLADKVSEIVCPMYDAPLYELYGPSPLAYFAKSARWRPRFFREIYFIYPRLREFNIQTLDAIYAVFPKYRARLAQRDFSCLYTCIS